MRKRRAISGFWPRGNGSNDGQEGFCGAISKKIQYMSQGTIKKIIADKGFGFIATEEGGSDLFFHRNGCSDSFENLREGDTVEYTSAQGPKGPCAENVKSV
ncbi:MAG: cold shock domain-containing protein [Verrucomicrobiales bacterium]|nr:cold shock domain-containing protein [Verrucomicrobiales bacterium]